MRMLRIWLFAMVVSFYTTFVLQALWNWFVVGSLNVAAISYWQMYGLNMLVQLVIERTTFEDDTRWKRAGLLMYACVPPEKKEAIDDEIAAENDSIWVDAALMMAGRALNNSTILAIGWTIHTLTT